MKKPSLAIIMLLAISGAAAGFQTKYLDTPYDSLEYRFLRNPAIFSVKEGGLIASGVPESNIAGYVQQISNIGNLARNILDIFNPRGSAEKLFSVMHKMALKKYKESATTLDEVLRSGYYNCLSSTLLYSALLEDIGVQPFCVALPTHIYTFIRIGNDEIDVENTSPGGFDIRTNKEAQDYFHRMTGYYYTRDTNLADVMDKLGLFAYTYANLAYFADRARQPYAAFQYALRAAQIYPQGRYVVSNVIAGYCGYAFFLADGQRDYAKAIAVLTEALSNYPGALTVVSNLVSLYNSQAIYLMNDKKDFPGAFQVLDEARKLFPDERVFVVNTAAAYNAQAGWLISEKKDYSNAFAVLEEAIAKFPGDPKFVSNMLYAYNNYSIHLIVDTKDYSNAISFLKKARDRFPQDKGLEANTAAAYNSLALNLADSAKDYKKALQVISEAISNMPGEKNLVSNSLYIYTSYIDYLIESGKLDDAMKVYEESKKDGTNRAVGERLYTHILFQLTEKKKDFDKAYAYSEKALKDLPDSAGIKGAVASGLNQYVISFLSNWQSYPRGEAFFLKWYGLCRDKTMDLVLEKYYSTIAMRTSEAGGPEKGLDVLKKGLTLFPDSKGLAITGLSIAGKAADGYFKKSDWDMGLKYSKIALAYDPRNETVLTNMQLAYRMMAYQEIEAKNYKKALAIVEEGFKYFPKDDKLDYYQKYAERKMKEK